MTSECIAIKLKFGPRPRPRLHADGNAACLVVVDSRGAYWERCIVADAILIALEHYGLPYRLLDLAAERPTPEMLAECAVIVLAQNALGASLSNHELTLLAQAVHSGIGVVNFDYDLRLYGGPFREIFGFDRVEENVYGTNAVTCREREHYITAMQEPGEMHCFENMVSAVRPKQWRRDVDVLARGILGKEQLIQSRHLTPNCGLEPGNHAVLFAARWGNGRAVQFTINMRMWLNGVLGHARTMDDLFWRSIVWAAKKPFAAGMLPPFICLSVDDCEGRNDFSYVETAAAHGYVSLPSLQLRNVPTRLYPKIRDLARSGKAIFNTHALSYYELLPFHFGKGECSDSELEERFAIHDEFWKKVGIAPSDTFRGHWGEYGVKSLPYFKRRGMMFFNPVRAMGVIKMDQHSAGGYWPYGLTSYMYDYLPDDSEIFGFNAKMPVGQQDFLTGCTLLHGESPTNDVEKAAHAAARIARNGLRSGFFGELVTHEQKFDALPVETWDRILARTSEMLCNQETIKTDHDTIAHSLRDKYNSSIARSHATGDTVRVCMSGILEKPFQISVFHDEAKGVRREYAAVETADGVAYV